MDPNLSEFIDSDTPKLNPDLANGLAVKHFRGVESYIDGIWRSAAKGFPEELKYLGYKRINPYEEADKTRRKIGKSNRRAFDMAPSYITMYKYMLSFNGDEKDLHRYLYLPYVGEAGQIMLSGARFTISPVLIDKVISVGESSIFVRLLRDKLTFKRVIQHFQINGLRETVQIPWSMIYHKNAKMKALRNNIKAQCVLAHYLFCKYGFTKTFEMFAQCRPIVGGAEINANSYPPDQWAICTTNGIPPRGTRRGYWEAPQVRVAVRKEELTPMVKSLIAGFFYVADHFPNRIQPNFVDSERLWKILLGQIIFSSDIHEGKLHDDIHDHIQSLNDYVDNYIIVKLRELKRLSREITDIYQLFAEIIENINHWLITEKSEVNSMYNKELSILYFVLYEITKNIFLFSFKLKAAAKKQLTINEVKNALNTTIKPGLIYNITRKHGEVTTTSSSGDNKALKITSILVPQSGSTRQGPSRDRAILTDSSKYLHESIAEFGGYLNQPKSNPTGRARLNLCAHLDSGENLVPNPKFEPIWAEVREYIKR